MPINDWKKYESVKRRLEHRLSITNSGYVGFPSQFYEDNGVANYKYALLYYSPSENAAGIRLLNEDQEKGLLKIHHNKDSKGGWIIAQNFFKTNNLDYKNYSGRYEWTKETTDGIGELFVIRLKPNENAAAVG